MSVIKELLRAEADGTLSFGNYELDQKSKLSDFEFNGDLYKVKTFKEITKLERNGMLVYESVPGTAVTGFKSTDSEMIFNIEGIDNTQVTVEAEDGAEYKVYIDDVNAGKMQAKFGGKLVLSVEISTGSSSSVKISNKAGHDHAQRIHRNLSDRMEAMKKSKTIFYCTECGNETGKWMGQCPGCKEWNSFVEEPVRKSSTAAKSGSRDFIQPTVISGIQAIEENRITTGMQELDRVLGGGIVKGSLILVGGDPGIGKSTLLLQMCRNISGTNKYVLYISGEESLQQIKLS